DDGASGSSDEAWTASRRTLSRAACLEPLVTAPTHMASPRIAAAPPASIHVFGWKLSTRDPPIIVVSSFTGRPHFGQNFAVERMLSSQYGQFIVQSPWDSGLG